MPPTEAKLATADIIMVVGYFILMLGIGAYFYGRMRRMKDFFSGGNAIPWWLSGVSFYMSSFSVAAFIFYPSVCYRYGWVGVTLLWVAVPATLFSVLLFSARWRRARIDSPVEYLETRYSGLLRQLFAWQGVPVRLIDDAIKLLAVGTFIKVCAGISIEYSILLAGMLILLYTLLGGLWAVAVTDFIQFIVLAVAIAIILPLSIMKAGGLSSIMQNTPEGFFNLSSDEFRWSYILPVILLYALTWSCTNWSLIQRYYCVPTEKDARKVGYLVAVLYVIGPPIMFFPAIAATQFLPGVENTREIYPLLCVSLLPAGMLGLAIAAMFAATMSSLSSEYNVCASVMTNDVYKRLFRSDASEKELVFIARVMTLVVGLVALGIAYWMSKSESTDLFRTMVTLFSVATPPVAVPMLLGLISRKMSNASAITGFLAGTAIGLALFFVSRIEHDAQFLGILWRPENSEVFFGALVLKMEIVMFWSGTLVTLGTMMVANLIAPASAAAQARIDAFIKRLDTPIGELPEDQQPDGDASMLSPFSVVGVSIALIGALMLIILPWVGGGIIFLLDALLAILLLVGGGAMAFLSQKSAE
jgi:solute:Na+ symporter, SSS family